MSKGQDKADRRCEQLGRRAALKRAVVGGAAVVSMVGGATDLTAIADEALTQRVPESNGPPWITGRIRRVVTGHNPAGRSCVISDEVVNIGSLWMTSGAQPLGGPVTELPGAVRKMGPPSPGEPSGLKRSDAPNVDPPPGGSRVSISTVQPMTGTKPNMNNRVGRHRTATVDYMFLLSGMLVLVLDEQEVVLNAGDFVVQRNTDHAWRNDGTEPARYLVTLVRFGA